jgi:hypothetical protein
MRMKVILCLFFGLIAGTLGVYGQLRLDTLPAPMKRVLGWKELPPGILTIKAGPSVRIMQPDHMSCVIANAAFLEPMPVRRMKSTDAMPNGVQVPGGEQPPDGGQIPPREKP